MASVNCNISFNYSTQQPTLQTGRIRAVPTGDYFDVNGKLVLANIPFATANIVAGSASLTLPSSEDYGVAIEFTIESGTSPNFTFVDKFSAIVPNLATQNGNTLQLRSFSTKDALDTSVQAIADLLTSEQTYLTRLSQRIPGFIFKPYTATETFRVNEFTFRANRFYKWIATSSGNTDPSVVTNVTDPGNYLDGNVRNNVSWQVASASLVGSGTTTTDTNYNKAGFTALGTEPASRKNLTQLHDILAAIATPNLTDYVKSNVANSFTQIQQFAAGMSTTDLTAADNSSAVPNTKWVKGQLANVSGASLLNRISSVEERRNQGVNSSGTAGTNVRQLNTVTGGTDITLGTGGIINLKAGTYLMIAFAVTNRADGSRLHLYDNSQSSSITTRSLTGRTGSNLGNTSDQNVYDVLIDEIAITANNTPVTLRHEIKTGATDALGKAANVSGFSEVYARLMLFRLS